MEPISVTCFCRNKPVGDVVRSLTYLFSVPGIVGKNLLT